MFLEYETGNHCRVIRKVLRVGSSVLYMGIPISILLHQHGHVSMYKQTLRGVQMKCRVRGE